MPSANALQTLRRQHRQARRLVEEARRGLPDAKVRLIAYVRAHVAAEDEVLLPAIEGDDEIGGATEDAYRDHEILIDALAELDGLGLEDAQLPALLDEIDDLLAETGTLEEGILFAYIERTFDAAALNALSDRLEARHPKAC